METLLRESDRNARSNGAEETNLTEFSFWRVLGHFDIWTIAMCMTISLMCLTFKEPVLALKLSWHNIDVTKTGVIISLDTITYTIASACLNFVKEEQNGKKYGRL